MNYSKLFLAAALCAALAGCTTVRPISNSGYSSTEPCTPPRDPYPSGRGSVAQTSPYSYRGELNEFDVLGIDRGEIATENQIRRALDQSRKIRLREGSSLMLIQSGAAIPDGPMIVELEKHFSVVPFSGLPPYDCANRPNANASLDAESYARGLRLVAARGGNDLIVCYWGTLESQSDRLPTKTVSWVPVVNWVLPDEKQHMRIRLKVALIDVRTGNWTVFTPKPFEDARISIAPRRGAADQKQVERLKREAYAATASELVQLYSE